MARVTKRTTRGRATTNPPGRRFWLAGLGAFSTARKRGEEAVEAIVAQSRELRGEADRLAKTFKRDFKRARNDVEKQVRSYVRPISVRAERVAKRVERNVAQGVGVVLGRLGVPSRQDILELTQRVDDLNRRIKAGARKRAA